MPQIMAFLRQKFAVVENIVSKFVNADRCGGYDMLLFRGPLFDRTTS